MLKESNLPEKYWSEMVRTANYLRNREPVTSLKITPFEAYTGSPPDVTNLRSIGQVGLAQVRKNPQIGWKKNQDRATRTRLVGYKGEHAYRMLYPNGQVKVVSNVKWLDNVPDPKPTRDPKPTYDPPEQSEPHAKRAKTSSDAQAEVDELLDSIRVPRSATLAPNPHRTRSRTRAGPSLNAPEIPLNDVSTAIRVEVPSRPPESSEAPQLPQVPLPKTVPKRPITRSTTQS